MKQVQPGDLALIVGGETDRLIGHTCFCIKWISKDAEIRYLDGSRANNPSDFMELEPDGYPHPFPGYRWAMSPRDLIPITPDESIIQEQTDEVAA